MGNGDLLLERESELAALDAALAAAWRNVGGVAFVRGPPGIGKSSLLAEAMRRAEAKGSLVLRARGGELERDFAFGVARQLFEPALRELSPDERAVVLQGAAALAAPVVGVGEDRGGPVVGDRLFAAMHGLYWLCANLASQRPVVIAVDDAHWADGQSLQWLAYLARRLADIPALVVVSARPEEGTVASAPLDAIAAEPLTRLLEPQPLSVEAVHALLAEAAAVEPSAEVARVCHERSAGNPFVIRELAVALTESRVALERAESADSVGGLLPDTVSRSVLRRVRRLSPAAVALAQAVAVLDTEVQLGDAARLAELGARAAADAVDVLVGAELLQSGSPLRFTHPLIRESIYEELPAGRRLYLHRLAADVIAERIAPERIGAHLLKCEPRGDPGSVEVLRRCGSRAVARGAVETAVRYLSRALAERPASEVRGAVLRELGTAEARVGRSESIAHLEDALALAETPVEIGAAARELALALGAFGKMPDAVAVLERQIEAVRGRDLEVELQLEGELGAIGQLDVSLSPGVGARMARLVPRLMGRTEGERLVLASYAHLRSNELAPREELVDLAERALADGQLLAERTADSPVLYLLVYVLYRADRNDICDQLLADALQDARRRGSLLGTSVALTVRGHLRWLRGELADAEADARTSMNAQTEAGWKAVLPLSVAVIAECLLERGQADDATRLFDEAGLVGELPEQLIYHWAQASRGRARIAAGDIDEGIADLMNCEREAMGARASIALQWRADAALALAARGDHDEARRLADEQLELAREAELPRIVGVALRTLGLLSTGIDAQHLLADAVKTLEGTSARLEHARTLVELGASIRRSGQRRAAREPLSAGFELARRCGSAVLIDRARAELAAAGVRLRRPALTGRDALTPSERRVAELAAGGMSNPEIAQALFVTRKTIEMHLGNVYRKLNVTGRDEVATALAA